MRDVSPLGASRFERPYSPPSTIGKSSAATSPTSANWPSNDISNRSTGSTFHTYSTTLSSFDTSLDVDLKDFPSPPCSHTCSTPEEPGNPFDTNRSDTDLSVYSDELPNSATLAEARELPVYDANGHRTTFGALCDTEDLTHQRHLVIFVRYFYCPACTAYLQAIAKGISMQDYYSIPVRTAITVIGCGQPDLIRHYKSFTGSRFQMYADPTRALFLKLGIGISYNIGRTKPDYMEKGLLGASREELGLLRKSLNNPQGIRKKDLLRGGHPMQVGGEFLFDRGNAVWCHRMTNYRNHAEVKMLRALLQLD
ncbi:hypothetical protein LTR37_004019 [Vermiconidia calcicola]|uniref:Uncharacterized protein n=1 Tax=Vermiconidia calcicola TaxID=1690605 RepID=A0ACC3NNX2_9PEZI|nr:hypothetical protein LTR37_004019 [Vermiconidia calcicola]